MYGVCWVLLCFLPLIQSDSVIDENKSIDAEDKVFQLILDAVTQAEKGITTTALLESVKQTQSLIKALENKVVSDEDVTNLLKSLAGKIGTTSALTAIFEEKIKYDYLMLNDTLMLWTSLAQELMRLKASGESRNVVLAAIAKISTAVEAIIGNMVVDANIGQSETENQVKELKLVAGVDTVGITVDKTRSVESVRQKRGAFCLVCVKWIGKWCAGCIVWG